MQVQLDSQFKVAIKYHEYGVIVLLSEEDGVQHIQSFKTFSSFQNHFNKKVKRYQDNMLYLAKNLMKNVKDDG